MQKSRENNTTIYSLLKPHLHPLHPIPLPLPKFVCIWIMHNFSTFILLLSTSKQYVVLP